MLLPDRLDLGDMQKPKAFLPFSPPVFGPEVRAAVDDVLSSGWVGTGQITSQFEKEFATYLDAEGHCAAVSSCTSGLFLGMKALGIQAGDEVISTNMTFVSTINSIIHTGATPVLVDVDSDNMNIDPDSVRQAITPKTRAILAVHYAGAPCDMLSLRGIADEFGLFLIEDCAHAIETMLDGKHAGTFGDFSAFSFYATKNIAIGEGGMVFSRSQELIDKVASLSLHGLSRGAWARFSVSGKRTYSVSDIGYKANMTDMQAVIGLVQLRQIEANRQRRREIWEYYGREIQSLRLEPLAWTPTAGKEHAMHLFLASLPEQIDRDAWVQEKGDQAGVAFGIHYRAVSRYPIYEQFARFNRGKLPISEMWGEQCISLSLSPGMSDSHVSRVVEALEDLRW